MKVLPDLKKCNLCGAISEVALEECPAERQIPRFEFFLKPRRRVIGGTYSSVLCKSIDFSPLTPEESEKIISGTGKFIAFFRSWPSLPSADAWEQTSSKDCLEKTKSLP